MRWLTTPVMVSRIVLQQLLECWRDVSNAGGAVGFPFPPHTGHEYFVPRPHLASENAASGVPS
jgi:hypothetical protein